MIIELQVNNINELHEFRIKLIFLCLIDIYLCNLTHTNLHCSHSNTSCFWFFYTLLPNTHPGWPMQAGRFNENGRMLYTCPRCDKYIGVKLTRHLQECGQPPMYKCLYCAHRSKRPYNLRMHALRKHPEML